MKRLAIEVMDIGWGKVLRIAEQTHRHDDFGSGNYFFVASNGFGLFSISSPESGVDRLHVRGRSGNNDNDIVVVPSEEWLERCRVAVREYNEHFADKAEGASAAGNIERIE